MKEIRINEVPIPIDLDLSLEVWIDHKGDFAVAVFTHGVNDILNVRFSLEDLYNGIDYEIEEPTKKLQKQAALEIVNNQKRFLKRMAKFIKKKGIAI